MKKNCKGSDIFIKIVMRPLELCGVFFAFTLLMCYVISAIGNLCGIYSNTFLSFLLPIFDCYIVCVIACLLKRFWLHWLWYILIGALLFGELFTIFYYRSNYTVFVLQLILEANKRECCEFVNSALFSPITWYSAGITACILAIAYSMSFLTHWKFRYRSSIIFVIFVLIVWSGIRQVSDYMKLFRCLICQSLSECSDSRNDPHLNSTFMRILYGTAFNMASSADLRILEKTVATTTVDKCDFQSPLIVLVIGESYNKYHSSLYGYHLPTSPRLSKLKAEGNLVTYEDVVTPFNLTSYAFRYIFSTWDEECDDSWLQHTLFPAVFKKAGYHVYFITNQFTVKIGEFHNTVGGTIINRPMLSKMQFTSKNQNSYYYDHELLSEIPPVDTLTSTPTLLIFHVNGQHHDYAERYPFNFTHFSPKDEITPFGGKVGKESSAHYDNATRYNDFVIDSLFSMIKDTEAIAIYLSDHGEEVYDWRAQFLRTSEPDMPAEVARYQYEIPLMFYMTDSYINKHGEIAQAVHKYSNRPYISTDLCHMLFHLAGISFHDYQERKDFLSPNYDVNRRRIIRNDVDYDDLISALNNKLGKI